MKPTAPLRAMSRGGFCFGAGEGNPRGAQPGRGPVLPHPAKAEPGFPHVVRIRTDTFLCPEKCPGCRVRWGETGRSFFAKLAVSLSGRRCGPGSFAQGGRVTVRRRTRRFGHFALKPGKVFAPRRTTRRQCRVWFGLHRAAGRAKQGRAPPCRAGAAACIFRQGVYNTIP